MQSATKHAYRPQKLKTLGAPFSQYFWRGAAQRRNFSGQVPTTPLGAPSSQDFGGPRIMKKIQEPPRTTPPIETNAQNLSGAAVLPPLGAVNNSSQITRYGV